MFFTAQLSFAHEQVGWTENVLISAADDSLAFEVAQQCGASRAVAHAGLVDVSFTHLSQISLFEYVTLAKFWSTFGEVALPGDAPIGASVEACIEVLADATNDELAQNGVDIETAWVLNAITTAMESCNWMGTSTDTTDFKLSPPEFPAPKADIVIYGPRIEATFLPQAWVQDYAVFIDGKCLVDVTAEVLSLPLAGLQVLADGETNTDNLVDIIELEHGGPFRVEAVGAICKFFGVNQLSDISEPMLARAKARAFENVCVEVTKEPQRIFGLESRPLTGAEMAGFDWELDCVVAIPADYPKNPEEVNAFVSTVLTGKVFALSDVQVSVFDYNYGPAHKAIRVVAKVSHPDRFNDALSSRGDKSTMRKLVGELNRADVFEMTTSSKNTRYRIVLTNILLKGKLLHLDSLTDDLWAEYSKRGVFEFVDPRYQSMTDDGEWLTLEDLAKAQYLEDGNFQVTFKDELVKIRFF